MIDTDAPQQVGGRPLQAVFLILALALAPAPAVARFQVFTTADGLAGDGVRAILEDRLGNLWFGTFTSGVSRFDGFRWKTFDASSGLPGSLVFDLMETSGGHVWVATESGLAQWDGAMWRSHGPGAGLPAAEALQLLEDEAGGVWTRFEVFGLARFNGNGWTRYTSANGLIDDRVQDMLKSGDGSLWFATRAGVSRFDGAAWTSFSIADGLAHDFVTRLLETESGTMWFATLGGLSRRDASGWTTFTSADGLANDVVQTLLEDDLGMLWAGTPTGLSRYDGTGWQTFTTADGLADDAVDVAFKDSRGHLWLGSEGSFFGITRWDGLAFESFTTTDGLAANHVSGILQDTQGNLWFSTGSPGAGVTRFDGAYVRSWATSDGLAHPLVLAVEADSADVMWVGTANGLNRFDGKTWRLFTSFDGLPGDSVKAILEDRSRRLWFGTHGGLASYDGAGFTPVAAVTAPVASLVEDSAGQVWAGTHTQGVFRFDGVSWTHFGTADGLAHDDVRAIVQSQDGAMWFGTGGGVSRFDGTSWTRYTAADGLAADFVHSAAHDSTGVLWFGTEAGASRFDGTSWQSYAENEGIVGRSVLAIHVSRNGVLWFCTPAGANRFDGERFLNFGAANGLAGSRVNTATSDGRGRIWFGTLGGLSRLEPDQVPPRGLVVPEPQLVSASRTQTLSFLAAFGEGPGITFSFAFDNEPFSPFSREVFVVRPGLPDGPHTFTVRAKDEFGNVQAPPTVVAFEVDATPPTPLLVSPSSRDAIRGEVAVTGTAADPRFQEFRVEVRPVDADSLVLASSSSPVTDDTLATWDTQGFADGGYDLRVVVADTLGLTGVTQIRVTVDNVFPFVDQTAPAQIVAALGGDVYTTNAELHLFFPPNAFDRDALVTAEPVPAGGVPDSLGPGIRRLTPGFDLAWAGAQLQKPATLEFSYAGGIPTPGTTPALYREEDGAWRRLGGTADNAATRVLATVDGPGRIALFTESVVPQGGAALSALALTPRVLSLDGRLASTRIAIGFSLGRTGPVTVKIYNRGGRLVREVASGVSMGPGANLVYWDGRDRDGDQAAEGIYLVTVEALDEKRTQTLGVVR